MTAALCYNRALLKQAICNYIKRVYLKRMLWMSIAMIFVLVSFFFFEVSPWLQAFGIVTALTIPTMLILGYWFRIQESLKRLALLDNGRFSVTVSDSGLTVESAMGKSDMKWLLFTELWEFPTNYLPLYANHQFITLPRDQVTTAFIGFIRDKLLANSTEAQRQ